MKRPSTAKFEVAIMWLENNEGEGFEREACREVAAWLDQLRSSEKIARIARKTKIPAKRVREYLTRKGIRP